MKFQGKYLLIWNK